MGQVTTNLRINTKSAQASLDAVIQRITAINKLSGQMQKQVSLSGASFEIVNTKVVNITKNIERQRKAQQGVNAELERERSLRSKILDSAKSLGGQTSLLGSKIRALASTYLGVMGAKVALTSADTLTSANNKFTSLGLDSQEVMDKIYSSSLNSYSGYADNMSNVAKMMTNAGDAFGGNVDAAIRFNEIMQKSYVLGGASAAEQASSMYQLVQALGSGVLQGDELRSVREGAPQAYKAIEEFAQGIYDTEESLKDLASQGKITSDTVVAAMLSAGDRIEEAFKNTDMTFAQLWTNFKTQALKAFQPVLEKMREFMNSEPFKKFVNNVVVALVNVATVVAWIFEGLVNVFNWAAENWSWLSGVFQAIIGALIAIYIYNSIIKFAAWAASLAEMTMVWPLLIVVAVLVAIVTLFLNFPGVVSGVASYIAAIIVNILLSIWNTIITVLSSILTFGISVIQSIVVSVLKLYNVIINVIAILVGGVSDLGTLVEIVAFNIGAWFTNKFLEAKMAGLDFAITVMNAIQNLASMINDVLGVFGIEINLDGLNNALGNLRKEKIETKASMVEYKDIGAALQDGAAYNSFKTKYSADIEGVSGYFDSVKGNIENVADKITPDFVSPTDWYNSGKAWGDGLEAKLPKNLSEGGLLDTVGGSDINMPTTEELLASMGDPLSDAAKGASGSAANTKKMADSMDLMSDELEYLRDIAEQEIINRYTGVTFNVGGITSQYTGENSVDGIVTLISSELREALEVSANGVHDG